MMMKSLLLSLAVVLLAICQLSEAAIPCKQQTGCMCKTDDFTIDISNAFDYPFNVSYTDAIKKNLWMAFACAASSCASDQDKAAMCQYDPGQNVKTNCGKAGEVVWTVTNRYSFKVLYTKGDLTFDQRERQSEITFTVSNKTLKSELIYQTDGGSDTKIEKYVFTANISQHRTPPTPTPPSPHCYSNDQLFLIIGVSSAVAIAVFTLTVATIVAVVIWLSGKGRQTKKSQVQYTRTHLEKSQAL